MLKKIITAALLFGSSTAALAAPGHGTVVVRDHRSNFETVRRVTPAPVVLHERHERNRYVDPGYYGYTAGGYYGYGPSYGLNYASQTPVVETFQPASQFIPMNDLTGNGIELSMIDGVCNIRELTIYYADGRQVIVPVGAYLDSMRPKIDILTETSPIAGITVVGTGSIGAYRY
jgi:hypothetical protein